MDRLNYLRREDLNEAGQVLWDEIMEATDSRAMGEDGTLMGPFNAWLHSPAIASHVVHLPDVFRQKSILDRALCELAILTVVAHWQAEFPWFAHSRMAAENGLSVEVVEAIATGEDPPLAAEDQQAIYRVARSLATSGRLSDDVFTSAHKLLGEQAMVELVLLCGYYTMGAFVLNAFEVPLPPGIPGRWQA